MSTAKPAVTPSTTQRILDVAERLVQTRGFSGFSYADVAAEVGISKASLHYHFPTKAELGRALIERYGANFGAALSRIAAQRGDARARLRAYVQLYANVLADERMCLCGMVAAEYGTLPVPMQQALQGFFAANEAWLAALLAEGARSGCLSLAVSADEAAGMLVGALEGAMLVARATGGRMRFESAARQLLASLESQALSRAPVPRPAGRTLKARLRAPRALRRR